VIRVSLIGFGAVEGRAEQRRVHLVRDLLQPPVQDRQNHAVESRDRAASAAAADCIRK
jgi:hypothetical protein